jgi:hypothetical protein
MDHTGHVLAQRQVADKSNEIPATATATATATSLIPPCPSDSASARMASRRCRSSRCGNNTWNLTARTASIPSGLPIREQRVPQLKATTCIPASPKAGGRFSVAGRLA